MKARKYTGTSDGAATGRRAGMVAFIDEIHKRSNGALWNNGDFVVRDVRGKADRKSTRLNSSHTRPSRMPSSA